MVQHVLHVRGHENALPMDATHGAAKPAKRGPKNVVKAEPESAQQPSPIATPQRRVLQALDGNRLCNTPQSAVTEAPGSSMSKPAFVSPLARLSTERKMRITPYVQSPGSAAEIGALSGQKRKLQLTEDPVSRKSDPVVVVAEDESEKDVEPASDTAENIAWLDMLVALVERRYRGQSVPVDVTKLQRADLFEHASQINASAIALCSSQQSSKADEEPSANSICIDDSKDLPSQSASQKDVSAAPSTKTKEQLEQLEKEREERRQELLLRHAQQIQDSSVTSTSCCGCKTGCLKMYVQFPQLSSWKCMWLTQLCSCRYCVCFSTRGFCHPQCTCDDCKNSRENKPQRLEAIQSYLSNDPRAFSLSSFQLKARTTGFLQLLPQVIPLGRRLNAVERPLSHSLPALVL